MTRRDGRSADELRPIKIQRKFTRSAPGSIYIQAGRTTVLCTASIDEGQPPWMSEDQGGWVTAEYTMLPGSTSPRKRRERNKIDSRSSEIQRLIGRSLRAVVNMEALGPRMITVDCDVLEADGGTRTLSITGGWIALVDAVASIKNDLAADARVFETSVAAISVGIVDGRPLLDLDYSEDSTADVDMNVVMTGNGEFVEVQGTAEGKTFTQTQLDAQLKLAASGIESLGGIQRESLGADWPELAGMSNAG